MIRSKSASRTMSLLSKFFYTLTRLAVFSIAIIVAALTPTLGLLWWIAYSNYIVNNPLDLPANFPSPFQLAILMAIFGAFGMASGFSSQVGSNALKKSMRQVALLFTLAALGLTLMGISLAGATPQPPAEGCCRTFQEQITGWILLIAFFAGASAGWFGGAVGAMFFAINVRDLWNASPDNV